MFDWLFGKVANRYSRKVYVTSSRGRGTQVFTVYGDTEVCAIEALRKVASQLRHRNRGKRSKSKLIWDRNQMRKNLKKILNLLPDSIVLSFTKQLLIYLKIRGAIKEWLINPSVTDEYEHSGLIIRLICSHINGDRWSERWNWYVYDGMYQMLEQGFTYDCVCSLQAAQKWIDDFMGYEDEDEDLSIN
jgi:hypothetical protein